MEVVPKESKKVDSKRNITELGLAEFSYNFLSEPDCENLYEELLIETIRKEDKIFLNNSNNTEIQNDEEEDSKENAIEQVEEYKTNISRIVQKILEKSNDEVLISFNALSFVLFVGVSE